MFDYEHQPLYVAENGKGNPAAGWMVNAEYISGQGIFVDVGRAKPRMKLRTVFINIYHHYSWLTSQDV